MKTEGLFFKADQNHNNERNVSYDIGLSFNNNSQTINLNCGGINQEILIIGKCSKGSTEKFPFTRLLHGRVQNRNTEETVTVIVNCGAVPPQFGMITTDESGLTQDRNFFTITHEVQEQVINYIDNLEVPFSSTLPIFEDEIEKSGIEIIATNALWK